MGEADRLVGVTSFCLRPKEAQNKQIVGNLLHPNLEEASSLNPDLLIATYQGLNPQVISKLEQLDLNLAVFDYEGDFKVLCDNFIDLGELLGVKKKAEKIVSEAKESLELIRQDLNQGYRPRIFWQYGDTPLISVGEGTFANDIIKYAGGENIFADIDERYPRINREEVVKRNPDVIILISMGESTMAEKERWLSFENLKAAQDKRIYIVDAQKSCSPTPVTFVEVVEEVASILNHEN